MSTIRVDVIIAEPMEHLPSTNPLSSLKQGEHKLNSSEISLLRLLLIAFFLYIFYCTEE